LRLSPLAIQYGRCRYCRITAMLRATGWVVNLKRVERNWRQEGLNVPQPQPNKGRLWLMTDPASGSGRTVSITCGRTTSSGPQP